MKLINLCAIMICTFVFSNANAFKQGIHGNITDRMLILNGFDEHSTDEVSDSN